MREWLEERRNRSPSLSSVSYTHLLATMYTANHFPGVKAIISLTESGYSPLIMSRIRSKVRPRRWLDCLLVG